METPLYQLKYDPKYTKCPQCNQDRYKRYINTHTNDFDLPYEVGRCERINSCGWFYKAKDFLLNNPMPKMERTVRELPPPIATYTSADYVRRSLADFGGNANAFTGYLRRILGDHIARNLIERFRIGTMQNWRNSTGQNSAVFWQIDDSMNTRGGKVVLYGEDGKRRKDGKLHGLKHDAFVVWHHKTRDGYAKNYTLVQCLFGLHQLETESENKQIAIVESEKTAIIMTAIKPETIWLATGGVHGAKTHECEALHGRRVVLLPDLGAENIWLEHRNKCIKNGINCTLKAWREQSVSESGLDIADFLSEEDFRQARENDVLEIAGQRCAAMWQYIAQSYPNRRITDGEYEQIWQITDQLQSGLTYDTLDTKLKQVYTQILHLLDNKVLPLQTSNLRNAV